MSTHTKGPWKAGRADMSTIVDGHDCKWIYSDTGNQEKDQYIAIAASHDIKDWGEVMANARLIAAAPELLEVCRELAQKHANIAVKAGGGELIDVRDWLEADVALIKARQIIAKVEPNQ